MAANAILIDGRASGHDSGSTRRLTRLRSGSATRGLRDRPRQRQGDKSDEGAHHWTMSCPIDHGWSLHTHPRMLGLATVTDAELPGAMLPEVHEPSRALMV